jgi:hypothetical protein
MYKRPQNAKGDRVMRSLLIPLLAIFAFGCGGSTNTDSTSPSNATKTSDRGNEIVTEHLKRDASPYRKDRVRFTVRSEGDPVEVYELDVWRRQTAKQTDTMSIIVKPVEDAGSGSLAIEAPDKPTVNVTYSAARGEFRETDTGKMFFGGLTAQELLGEWNKYAYKFVGEREVDGKKALEIEGKLKDGQKSVIASNKALFDAQSYVLLEMRLFDSGGKEMRVFRQKEIKTESGHSYVSKTEVENHIYNSNITIEILSREYPAKIDDSVFSREKLKQSVRE